jgi:hypothetical protein
MKPDKPQGRATRDLSEENGFVSIEQTRVDIIQETFPVHESFAAVEFVDAGPGGNGRPRNGAGPAEQHHTLLQDLERLSHSLRGPEHALDRVSYNRPFPPPTRPRNT